MSEYATSASGEKMHGWEIIPIEDKLKEGAYIEDSQEASAHLMRAMGLDATLVGAGPGRNMGAGSGSDKRIAFNIYVALLQPYRDVILEPLNFISDYNGWTERIEGLTWRFREAKLETLDKGQGTAVEQIN
ncbi:hypothetical protein D3C79_803600 [compost metagenome]